MEAPGTGGVATKKANRYLSLSFIPAALPTAGWPD
jgi:hypothetical protein